MKNKKASLRLTAVLLCLAMLLSVIPFMQMPVFATGTASDQDLANKIVTQIAYGTGTDWEKELKDIFAEKTGINSTAGGDAIKWFDTSTVSDISAPWDGTALNVAGAVTSHTTGTADLVKESTVADGLTTTIYKKYKTDDTFEIALKTVLTLANSTTDEYHVYTPEALRYVMDQFYNNWKGAVYIEKNMDMNGANYNWTHGRMVQGQGLYGNNHTIYNLRNAVGESNARFGFITSGDGANRFYDLHFQTGYLCANAGSQYTGVFGYIAGDYKMVNVTVDDYTIFGGQNTAGLVSRGNTRNATNRRLIEKCSVTNSVIFGTDHVGSLTGCQFLTDYQNCYSVGCMVISTGTHSGGLISCGNSITCTECFTDVEVYGSMNTGVFIGSSDYSSGYAPCVFNNCYASGFIDGTTAVGGFVGAGGDLNANTITFNNCYSTALTGMRKGGTILGGFIGRLRTANGPTIIMNDCYAAGEVGAADTDVSPNSTGIQAQTCGGFVGGTVGAHTNSEFTNCYYDKQTTAMREWGVGEPNATAGITNDDVVGCLTTDTIKSGTGLTSSPGTTGFTGFSDNSQWDFSTQYHYPELQCFSQATPEVWGDAYQLVRDYSKTSTSTVMLETWEKSLDKETGVLKTGTATTTTYDTVRDLTVRFHTTGDISEYAWYRTEFVNVTPKDGDDANKNGASVTIAGNKMPVMTLSTKKSGAETVYYADQFSPGLEWLLVTYGSAQRRLRVMPTVGVDAGKSNTIYRPSDEAPNNVKIAAFYDHADDVELYYSTAERMALSMSDITTGIFPDASGGEAYASDYLTRTANNLSDRQKLLMSNSIDTDLSAYFSAHGDNTYGVSLDLSNNKTYPGVDASYMSRAKDETVSASSAFTETSSANNSKVYVYGRVVTGIDSTTGAISVGSNLIDFTDATMADVYNGLALNVHEDQMIMLEYMWELADGRVVNDAKLITIRATPFNTVITAYDAGGLNDSVPDANKILLDSSNGLLDSNDMYVNMQKLKGLNTDTAAAAALLTPDNRTTDELLPYMVYPEGTANAGQAVDESLIGPEYSDSLIASWTLTNEDKAVTKIRLSMDSGRNDENGNKVYFFAEINPLVSDTVELNYEYYRYITEDDGQYYVKTETLKRTYTIKLSGDTYYLLFNTYKKDSTTDLGFKVDEVDVANNIKVELELSATLKADKIVSGDYGDANQLFDFTLSLDDLTGKTGNTAIKYPYYITDINGNKTQTAAMVAANGDTGIKLKHGDSLTVQNLPYGAKYSLTESDYSAISYLTTVDDVPGRAVTNGTLSVTALPNETGYHSADRAHVFHNNKYVPPSTGIFLENGGMIALTVLAVLGLAGLCVAYIRRKRRYQS